MLFLRDITVRAGLLRIALMWAIRACRRRKSVPSCLRRRRQRIALRQAPAHASRAAPSTTTAALVVARGAARPDIPTPVSSSSMRSCSRRRIQISALFATQFSAATRAACRRTNGTARGRPPVIKLYVYTCPVRRDAVAAIRFELYSIPRNRRRRRPGPGPGPGPRRRAPPGAPRCTGARSAAGPPPRASSRRGPPRRGSGG